MTNRSTLIALFVDVHEERVALQTLCTCPDCAAEFNLAKARKLKPIERKGHVLDDTPIVLAGAKRIAAVFAQWRKQLLAEIERVTKPTLARKAMEFVGLAKADAVKLDIEGVDAVMRSMFGPTKQQRLEELSRPRLLSAIDGYKQGQALARAALEDDVVLGPVKEIGQELIDNMLAEAMRFSETTLQVIDGRIRDELLASVLRGDGVNETSDRIGEVFGGLQDYEALRIARTETAQWQTKASCDVYQEQGAKYARWVKSPASCPICEAYDGRIYRIEDYRAHFPAHPNDTCTAEFFDELAAGEEVEKDPPWNVFDDKFTAPVNLKKGDLPGHPFRGNQYVGAEEAISSVMDGKAKWANFARVSSPIADRIAKELKLNVTSFTHRVEESAVNHVANKHPDITRDDWMKVPSIVESPDRISRGKTKRNLDTIKYEKKIGDKFYYVEEVRQGHQRLATVTFYKEPSGAARAKWP